MKTTLQAIEERIKDYKGHIEFYEAEVLKLDPENEKGLQFIRAQRGHILAAIEELEWCKKLVDNQLTGEMPISDKELFQLFKERTQQGKSIYGESGENLFGKEGEKPLNKKDLPA